MILGAHMPASGGVDRALQRATSVGCEAVQIFTRNQLRWHSPALDPEAVVRFRALIPAVFGAPERARRLLLAHASYLINLASVEPTARRRSVSTLADELRRCEALGVPLLVLHPGAHRGDGADTGGRRLRDGLVEAFAIAGTSTVDVLLETTAGTGTTLGGSFEEMRDLLGLVSAERVPCGVCLDSCHVFAAGYELRDPEGYARTWELFDARIGRPYLRALHLNDSLKDLGSRVDRHAHIGRGCIGLSGFGLLVNDPALAGLPGILETPKGRDLKEDVENLARLRALKLTL
jgi:deoxyribonuclease-4